MLVILIRNTKQLNPANTKVIFVIGSEIRGALNIRILYVISIGISFHQWGSRFRKKLINPLEQNYLEKSFRKYIYKF